MDISYRVIRSCRKTVALQITPEGEVLVRCPNRMRKSDIEHFVAQKRPWLEKHLQKRQDCPPPYPFSEEELQRLAQEAKLALPQRIAHFAPLVGVTWNRVTVRAQRSRWGSCSSKGNLNFNCLLMLAPEEVLDYVVVHELCHRLEMNHSVRFWAEVERILPDYRIRRKWLKDNGPGLIARLPK